MLEFTVYVTKNQFPLFLQTLCEHENYGVSFNMENRILDAGKSVHEFALKAVSAQSIFNFTYCYTQKITKI